MAEQLGVLEIALGVEIGGLVSGLSKAKQEVLGYEFTIAEMAKKAIEAASEAQAAAARIAGIFGSLSKDVNEFSEQFGKAAGRASSDIQGMVATFGGMIAPMVKSKETAAQMSEGLTEMAVNLSKAAHISADEAMGALQGALAGHGRELARLGIVMDATAMKAQAMQDHLGDVSKLSVGQREMVAYQVIMAQLGQVTERAAAQSGTYDEATKQAGAAVKELAEVFGNLLLPTATAVMNALAGFARIVAQFPAIFMQTGQAIVSGLAPALQWMEEAFSKVWEVIKQGVAGVRDMVFMLIEGIMQGVEKLMNALAATGHADWADKAAGAMHSGGEGMETARKSMTAENIGGAISSGMQPVVDFFKADFFKNLADTFKEYFGAQKPGQAPAVSSSFSAGQFAAAAGAGHGPAVHMEVLNSATGAMHTFNQAELDAYNAGMQELTDQQKARSDYSNAELDKFMKWQDDVQEAEDAAEEAFKAAAAKTFKDLEHTAVEGAGKLGQAISQAMKAASTGGPLAGLESMGESLLSSSQGGQAAMNVINTIFQMLANTLGQLANDILPILGTVQNLLEPILGALGQVLQSLAPLFKMVGGFLATLQPIFQALASILKVVGDIIGTVVSVLASILVPVFQALAPLFSVIGIILTALAPVLDLVKLPLEALGVIFQALTPVFQIVGDIFRVVGIVVIAIFLGLADAWNAIAGVISGIVNGIIDVINWFIDAINSALGWAGVHINDLNKVDLSIDTSGLQNSLNELMNNSYDASDATGSLAASADQATAALTNLPQGYKIALREFQNMNAVGGDTGTGGGMGIPKFAEGGYIERTGLAIIHAGETVVPAQAMAGSSGGGAGGAAGGGITINATIVSNDPDKIWAKLQDVMQRAQMKRYSRPINGGTRFSTPNDAR